MVALRCTRRLLTRLRADPQSDVSAANNALGHWYASVLTVNRIPIVHAISERSLLSVVVPGAPFNTLLSRFPSALAELLHALGVPGAQVANERAAMATLSLARTANRKVLGCLNQYMFELTVDFDYYPKRSLLQRELWLSENISSAIRYGEPREVALELLASGGKQ